MEVSYKLHAQTALTRDEIFPVPIAQEDRILKLCSSKMRLSLPSIELQSFSL
jgi:hypothetical protein